MQAPPSQWKISPRVVIIAALLLPAVEQWKKEGFSKSKHQKAIWKSAQERDMQNITEPVTVKLAVKTAASIISY